jgi:hypothetical protein
MDRLIMPSCYFGSIAYYAVLAKHPVVIDLNENYRKQTYRTRCDIYGANGRLSLSVPVVRPHMQKTPVKEIALRYDEEWRNIHWRSLTSAYRRSPYFEYYEDLIAPIFEAKYSSLRELNEAAHLFVCDALQMRFDITSADEYVEQGTDFRGEFKPSKNSVNLKAIQRYFQVFEEKEGFLPNLSILDLIFNQGPESVAYLQTLSLDTIFINNKTLNLL